MTSENLNKEFIQPHILSGMPPETPILIGFSGGADSCALLDFLHTYSEIHGTKLYAAHIHHGIRGDEANRDLEFCRKTVGTYGIEFFSEKFDVPALAACSGESLEGCGRTIRYRYFSNLMRDHGIPLLALAHHADDNLETVIYNMLRGSGAKGMCGILPTRKIEDVHGALLIRPLIYASKAQILQYCEEKNLQFVTDSTNLEDDCTRNKIRHTVIPALEQIRPEPQKSCSKMSSAILEDCQALDALAETEFAKYQSGIPLDALKSQPTAIAKRMILLLCRQNRESAVSSVKLDAVLNACKSKTHSEITISASARAVIARGKLKIAPNSDICCDGYDLSLQLGINLLPGGVAVCVETDEIPDGYIKITSAKVYPFGRLSAHTRRPNDKINTMGMTKSLKKLYNERKVPAEIRPIIPIICDENGVLLVPDCAIRTDCANGETTVTTLFSDELYSKFNCITERKHDVDK